jgi:DNA polymerase-3 subunit beta
MFYIAIKVKFQGYPKMDILVKKDALLRALNHVLSVVERRNSIPILANLKFVANENRLVISATDLDIAVEDNLEIQCNVPGNITLPATTLYEIIRKISDNTDVRIYLENPQNSNATIHVGTSEFNLPTLPVEGFPNFELSEAVNTFKINSEVLYVLFNKTRHAISVEETRYYLNGSYLHVAEAEDGTPVLRVVATDGHRLARSQTICPEGAAQMPGIIVPKKTVNELIKLLEDFSGDVEVSLSANRITFIVGSATLSSRLIDGKFPDYERVIPKNNDKTLEVSRSNLARSIDLVISISNDKTRSVKFNIESSKLVVTASSDLNGNARGTQEMAANYNSGDPITIGFNSKYVLDSLSAIEGDTVCISLSSNVGAVIATDLNEKNFLYLLMPMQV